jgi:hypothetical protein
MKRIVVAFLLSLFLVALLGSCKGSEECPAYDDVTKQQRK